MMQHHPHRHHTHALTWCGHFHSTIAADNQFLFLVNNKTLTMLEHTNKTNLQRKSWLENQHTISAACDTAGQSPQLQRVVMYTPPLFQQLPTRPHSYQETAIIYSCFTFTALGYQDGRIQQQKKVTWLKASCGAHPSCVQTHPIILHHSRHKQHPKARWLGSCFIYSGLQ